MTKQRVVVTGLGTINPLGNNVIDTWNNLTSGISGIDHITLFDASDLPVTFAGEVKNFDANEYMGKQNARKLDRSGHLSIFAAEGATEDAVRVYDERGSTRISPLAITQLMPNSSTGQVAIKYGIQGPSLTITTACAASANAIGEAKRMIEQNIVDIVLVGGTESGTTSMTIGAFAQIKALSKQYDEPQKACKPFDKNRDGFVMAEGSTVLILESESSAKDRDAKIYGYISGYGSSTDAYHITAPSEGGVGALRAMEQAISNADISKEKIDYINAHGTSTPANDLNETLAIKSLMNDYAYEVNISSTKSMTGHLLGGGGAFEAMASLLSMKNSLIPPTINLNDSDEDCDLNYTANHSIEKNIDHAMSNSFGFGGHNAVLIFSKQ